MQNVKLWFQINNIMSEPVCQLFFCFIFKKCDLFCDHISGYAENELITAYNEYNLYKPFVAVSVPVFIKIQLNFLVPFHNCALK